MSNIFENNNASIVQKTEVIKVDNEKKKEKNIPFPFLALKKKRLEVKQSTTAISHQEQESSEFNRQMISPNRLAPQMIHAPAATKKIVASNVL